MILEGDSVLVGVSGGGDSVCLLSLLREFRKEIPFTLRVLHVEHGIRKEESVQDMEFVEDLCARWEIPCKSVRLEVPAYAKKEGLSMEEAARKLRYEALYEEAERIGGAKIAVAHHANDLMETMLFFLCRGCGIKGLYPMEPVSGQLIRPLLCVTKAEIEEYLKNEKLQFCIDATNEDTVYTRNRIRKEIIPILESVNEGAVEHFFRTANRLRQADEVLQKAEAAALLNYVGKEGADLRIGGEIVQEPIYIRQQVVRKCLSDLAGQKKDLTGQHVEAVLRLFGSQVGSFIMLPYQIRGEREYEGVRLYRTEAAQEQGEKKERPGFKKPIFGEENLVLPDGSRLSVRIFEKNERISEIPEKSCTKWMDYDIIKNKLEVRYCQPEDFFVMDAVGHKKTIKKFFVDEKIPKKQREEQLVLASESHVYWVLGRRMAEDAKVTGATRRIMEISIDKGDKTDE